MGIHGLTRAHAPAVAAAGLVALLLGSPWLSGAAHARAERSGAQPRYVSSDPSPGETRHQAPDRVSITFDEPLDSSSEITVTDRCDRRLDDGNTRVEVNEMSVGIARKPSGAYHVAYKATGVGGVTGTRFASFSFEVHMGPACDGGPSEHRHPTGNGQDRGHEHSNGNGEHPGEHPSDHQGNEHQGNDHAAEVHGERHASDLHAAHRGPGGRDHHPDEDAAAPAEEGRDLGPLAAGGSEPAADAGAVLIGLGLATALGVLGGWILRVAPS